jgi:spermidine/putrescine transport system substrate-binding protein
MSWAKILKLRISLRKTDFARTCAVVGGVLLVNFLMACGAPAPPPTLTPEPLAAEIIFYDWIDDEIQSVFAAFTEEYGVNVTYVTYDSTEEAVANLRAGKVYDVVVVANEVLPQLIAEGLLAEIDYRNVPNLKNISLNFRDLAYDPGNKHSIPYSWGTTGLVVRTDLVAEPVVRWADLWDPRYAGRVAIWETTPRFALGAALKSLGYSVNSEDPVELEAALEKLIEHKASIIWLDKDDGLTSAPWLIKGKAVMALGWSQDVWAAQEESEAIAYVLPQEGTVLWGDNFVVPASSPNQKTAELFLDFVQRPEIAAQIIKANYYPMANEAAKGLIDPAILNDPVVYPTNDEMKNAEILLPLSPEGEALYQEIWDRFLAVDQQGMTE